MNKYVRKFTAAAAMLALAGCGGAAHLLPQVSEGETNRALSEIEAAPALQIHQRSATKARGIVFETAKRLEDAAGPVCDQLEETVCVFNIQFNDADEMNAYATGENKIVFFQGLAKYLQSEDEFAAVIAHEMGHHIADHIDKSQGNQLIGSILTGLLFALVTANSPGYVNSYQYNQDLQTAMNLGSTVGAISFSKEHEREADYISAYILARAGYDLSKARSLWMKFTKESGRTQTGLFDTHPAGPERLTAWDKSVAEVALSKDFLPKLDNTGVDEDLLSIFD